MHWILDPRSTVTAGLDPQVMRVSAPWLRKVVLDDRDDGNYVIPNLDTGPEKLDNCS